MGVMVRLTDNAASISDCDWSHHSQMHPLPHPHHPTTPTHPQVSGSLSWLEWASDLQSSMDAHFWDDESGGYFHNHADDPHVRVRFKEDTDNAEPAGEMGI